MPHQAFLQAIALARRAGADRCVSRSARVSPFYCEQHPAIRTRDTGVSVFRRTKRALVSAAFNAATASSTFGRPTRSMTSGKGVCRRFTGTVLIQSGTVEVPESVARGLPDDRSGDKRRLSRTFVILAYRTRRGLGPSGLCVVFGGGLPGLFFPEESLIHHVPQDLLGATGSKRWIGKRVVLGGPWKQADQYSRLPERY